MTGFETTIGTTLSQRALACHLDRSVSWVRNQGETVYRFGEKWERMEWRGHPGRCAGYRRVV
ncbi:MAG TPA: hypothetical protein VKW08_08085 [Xanthobacteraceae bacterium]|nr:hypothetical protein [Xanthobacteraceae bacterium]